VLTYYNDADAGVRPVPEAEEEVGVGQVRPYQARHALVNASPSGS